jgi:hypothetical protein
MVCASNVELPGLVVKPNARWMIVVEVLSRRSANCGTSLWFTLIALRFALRIIENG